jgi:hypothetical protein
MLVLATPNLVLATAVFFALATIARSALAAYLGAIALLVLYGLGSSSADASTLLLAMLDPFGFGAVRFETGGWGAVERATNLPPIAGALALNRLVWLSSPGAPPCLRSGGGCRARGAAAGDRPLWQVRLRPRAP